MARKKSRFRINAHFETEEPYYDLFDGGDMRPEELLKDPNDAAQVRAAIDIVKKFLEDAEASDVILYR